MLPERGASGVVPGLTPSFESKHTDSCGSSVLASRQKNALVDELARNARGQRSTYAKLSIQRITHL